MSFDHSARSGKIGARTQWSFVEKGPKCLCCDVQEYWSLTKPMTIYEKSILGRGESQTCEFFSSHLALRKCTPPPTVSTRPRDNLKLPTSRLHSPLGSTSFIQCNLIKSTLRNRSHIDLRIPSPTFPVLLREGCAS